MTELRTLSAFIAEHGGLIQTGPFGSQLHQHEYMETGVPVVMPKDIIAGRVNEGTVARISEQKASVLSRHELKQDDIIFPRRGAISKCALIDARQAGFLCGTGCLKIELPKEALYPRFVYYYLGLSHVVEWLERNAIGTTMLNLNTRILGGVKIPVIPLAQQERIANRLSTYDDFIENNRRRVALLEQSARVLYREWFVHLRFPGHEHVKVVNGVPEGWERKRLIELCESVDYGYTASASHEEIGPKFLRITDIVPDRIEWSSVPHCQIEDRRKVKFLLAEGDIVIARTGATVGFAKRIHARHPESVFASYLVRLRPNEDVDNVLLGVFVESQAYKDYVKAHVGGAAQPNANAQVLAAAEILLPPLSLRCDFRDLIYPIFDQKEILQQQNEKLAQARELLLPRLMSGEIEV